MVKCRGRRHGFGTYTFASMAANDVGAAGLEPGMYDVTVTDENVFRDRHGGGGSGRGDQLGTTVTDATCFGDSNGSASGRHPEVSFSTASMASVTTKQRV